MNIIAGGNYLEIKSKIDINLDLNILNEINKYFTFITKSNFPKYNIIYIDNNNIYIEISLAGFIKENLKIIQNECEITVTGNNDIYNLNTSISQVSIPKYLIKNISTRNFSIYFYLKPNIIVSNVKFENGILAIYLNLKIVNNNTNYLEIK